jgi:hypothetical protein
VSDAGLRNVAVTRTPARCLSFVAVTTCLILMGGAAGPASATPSTAAVTEQNRRCTSRPTGLIKSVCYLVSARARIDAIQEYGKYSEPPCRGSARYSISWRSEPRLYRIGVPFPRYVVGDASDRDIGFTGLGRLLTLRGPAKITLGYSGGYEIATPPDPVNPYGGRNCVPFMTTDCGTRTLDAFGFGAGNMVSNTGTTEYRYSFDGSVRKSAWPFRRCGPKHENSINGRRILGAGQAVGRFGWPSLGAVVPMSLMLPSACHSAAVASLDANEKLKKGPLFVLYERAWKRLESRGGVFRRASRFNNTVDLKGTCMTEISFR